jgi:uncharacterized membrane protein
VTLQAMIKSHPQPPGVDRDALLRCVEACLECAASCTSCADADLAENDVREMVRCIRLCLDCADACTATARIVTRQTAPDLRLLRAMVEACAAACQACGDECERNAAHHDHCRICAEVCRRCLQACNDLVATIG